MIRVRTLATTCARECVRSAAAARGFAGRGSGARAAVARRAFSKSSFPSAQPPFDTAVNASTGTAAHAEGTRAIHPGQYHHGSEENAEDVGEMLRRQTQARDDWTQAVEMSEYERVALSKDFVRRIRGLTKAPKSTKIGFAIKILDEGRQRGITSLVIYEAVLKQLLSTYSTTDSASKNLEVILERMREDGLKPDLKVYNRILDFHASVRDQKKAVEVYEEMLERGLEPDQRTTSHMIVAHSRGNHLAMYSAVEEMNAKGWKGSRAAYLSMIAVMAKRGDFDRVLHTFHRMRAEWKKPTEAACFVVFRAAENLGQVETAKQVFDYRIEFGMPPREYAYVKMMVMLMNEGQPDKSLGYWRQLVCMNGLNDLTINRDTYNLAIKCATRAGNLKEMEAVLEMMETQGIVPTETTYYSALAGFERPISVGVPPCMEEAERAFASIAKTGPPQSTSLRQRQAVGYAHAGMWQKAFDLFQPVLAEKAQLSARDWKCLMMSQFELGKYAEVKATWILSTEGRDRSHSYKAIEIAFKAANLLEDADWALQLRKATSKGSVDLDHAVVEVLLKAGRLEEARAVLKESEALVLKGSNVRLFQRAYEFALATCEKRQDAQLALQFLDGMRSATQPYTPNASCPSFLFLLKALKDNGRAVEVLPFFDDVRASPESVGESGAISHACFAVVAEAEELCRERAASSEPASCSTEGGTEGRETGEGETGETPSPMTDMSA